jgi:hypothetical protein
MKPPKMPNKDLLDYSLKSHSNSKTCLFCGAKDLKILPKYLPKSKKDKKNQTQMRFFRMRHKKKSNKPQYYNSSLRMNNLKNKLFLKTTLLIIFYFLKFKKMNEKKSSKFLDKKKNL